MPLPFFRSLLSKDIKSTFDLASMRLEASMHLNDEEWKIYQKIKQRYDGQRRFEKRAYELEREQRLGKARRRLINKAGQKNLNLVHRWFPQDRFNKAAINRQAERDVRKEHLQVIRHLDAQETEEIHRLLESSEQRKQAREKPHRDFNRATDRRSGQERRVRKRN